MLLGLVFDNRHLTRLDAIGTYLCGSLHHQHSHIGISIFFTASAYGFICDADKLRYYP